MCRPLIINELMPLSGLFINILVFEADGNESSEAMQ